MDALPYYKWHWQDWRANRRVQRMPWQAKGPYRELLDEFWAEGSLPADMNELADIVGCSEVELTELWVHIGPCWDERDGRLYNSKMDLQRTAIDRARVAMSTGGSNGGKASNSFTRAKATEANDKPTLEVPEGMPDIGEERRLEKRREKKSSSLAKASSGKVTDPRHVLFKEEIKRYMEAKGCTFIWDASEAKSMGYLLKAVPTLTIEVFQKCLLHRARSPGTPHGERPRLWLPNILRYQQSPLTQFNRTEEVNAISKADQREQRNAAAIRTAVEPEQYTGGSPQGFAPAPSFASRPRPDGDGDDRLFGDFGRLLEGSVD